MSAELSLGNVVKDVETQFYDYSRMLYENGNFGGFQRAEILTRQRHGGQEFKFRSGMSYTSREEERTPKFEIYEDVVGSLRKEFSVFLGDHASSEQALRAELVKYVARSALGEMLFNERAFSSRFPRTPSRINWMLEMLTESQSLLSGIELLVPDEAKQEVFKYVSGYLGDDALVRINGIRAGHTLFRALSGVADDSPADSGVSTMYQEAFVSHVLEQSPIYEKISESMTGSISKGIKALSYFIPEWLFVGSFPMHVDRVNLLLDEGV